MHYRPGAPRRALCISHSRSADAYRPVAALTLPLSDPLLLDAMARRARRAEHHAPAAHASALLLQSPYEQDLMLANPYEEDLMLANPYGQAPSSGAGNRTGRQR
jgi:hypothetical protein